MQRFSTTPAIGTIHSIWRWPIKGFPGQQLDQTIIESTGIPLDRHWGITSGYAPVPSKQRWDSHIAFLCLKNRPELTTYALDVGPGNTLHITSRDGENLTIDPSDPASCERAAHTFSRWFPCANDHRPRIVEARATNFFDDPEASISIINTSSVHALMSSSDDNADDIINNLMRFRANIYLQNCEPWSEFNLLGKKVQAGSAILEITERTGRCSATCVNPQSGCQDINVPAQLRCRFDHTDCGVYAKVISAGSMASGQSITIA